MKIFRQIPSININEQNKNLVAEFAFPPSSQQLLLSLFGCEKGFFFWWQDGFSRCVTLVEPPRLCHPSPPNIPNLSQPQISQIYPKFPKFNRGKFPPSCQINNSWFPNHFNLGRTSPGWGLEDQRRNSRVASAFPLLPQCLEQQILLSFHQKGSKCLTPLRKKWILEAKAPKKSAFFLLKCRSLYFL